MLADFFAMKFFSEKAIEILEKQQKVDSKQFAAVRKRLEQLGYTVCQDEETDRYLEMTGKEAAIVSTSDERAVILFHTKLSASGMFEELIHLAQVKKIPIKVGVDNESKITQCRCEIEAKEKLLQNSKAYGITDYEVTVIKNSIEDYKEKLWSLENGM